MAIILLLKTLLTHLFGIIYVGAITWLFPMIIVVAILLMFGINASKLFTAGAKTIGQLFVMAGTAIINAIPRFIRLLVRFWHFMRIQFAKIMPDRVAAILAWVVLIII